ncbi:MAG: 4a-hydroxytetrahydrobiopterin dehydratase [Stenotrophobium sp.]
MPELAQRRCIPCEGNIKPHDLASATRMKASLRPEWALARDGKLLEATFEFRDYYRTQAFVNAVAYIAHHEDHHPEMVFGYKTCTVRWWTHAIDGLSDNDFICAAKVDALA